MKEYSLEVSLRRRKNFRVEYEGEVIDLCKEEEERRKKKFFGNLGIWITNEMSYFHGSGRVKLTIQLGPIH
jgi:hypothetical protein